MAESPDPENCLVPGEEELQHAICMLTSTEKDIITDVLQRDKEVRSQEKQRLSDLKAELDEIKIRGVPEGEESKRGRICVRCQTPLGAVFNKGDLCPWCRKKVCRNCRRPTEKSWLCVLCYKEREIKGESGEWFYGSLPKKKKLPYGSTLLKKLIKRRKSQAYKLSKSRNKSDDDSCEIEYAIAETFGDDASSKDREYVLVDRESNGSISISEGNVVSYDHFGSEAAALSSIDEVQESEATVNDIAFTGMFASGVGSNEMEARRSVGQFHGPDSIVHGYRDEKKERESRVKLIVEANPFLDDEEDSETEEKEEDRKVKESESPEVSAQSQIPPKPIRGIMRSTEDLNRLSIGQEALSSSESEKKITVVIESNENEEMAVEKHFEGRLEEPCDAAEKKDVSSYENDDRKRNEVDTPSTTTELVGDDESRNRMNLNEEIKEASVCEDSEDDVNVYARKSDDESGKETIAMNDDSVAVKFDARTGAVVSGDADVNAVTYLRENGAENEEGNDIVYVAQRAEDVNAEKISATVTDADSIALSIATPPAKEISSFNVDTCYENSTEKGFLDQMPVVEDSQNLKIDEEVFMEVNSDISAEDSFNSKRNERAADVVSVMSGADDGKVENGSEAELRNQALTKESEAVRDEREIEKGIKVTKDPIEVEEKQLSFKERMNFYKRKESENSGKRVKLEMAHKKVRPDGPTPGSTVNSEITPATETESRALQSNRVKTGLFTEDENRPSEENDPGLSEDPENEKHTVEFLNVSRGREEEQVDKESQLKAREESFTSKDLERKVELIERNEEVMDVKVTSGALEFELTGEEEVKSNLQMNVNEDVLKDEMQELGTDINISEGSRISNEKQAGKISVESREDSKEDVTSYEEHYQSMEIAPSKCQLLNEDNQVLKSDVNTNEDREVINTVADDISVPEKEPVKNVTVPMEREVEVTYGYESEKSNGLVESSKVDDKSLAVDSTIRDDDDDTLTLPSLNGQLKAESSLSIASYQSDTELYDTLRPELKVAGQILLGLKFDHGSQQFEVQVHKATDLIAVDTKKNTSDPYVKTYLQEGGVRLHKKKTKAKKQTLNPVFDEIIKYKIDYERLIDMSIAVSVWHNDIFGQNVFLGETQIAIAEYLDSGYSLDDPTPQQYQLAEKRLNRNDMKDVGEVVIEMKYIPPGGVKPQGKPGAKTDPLSGQLVVRCVEGKNLNGTEDSNPFCELRLASVKSKGKKPTRTTDVEAKTVNPYWDQEVLFDNVTFNELTNSVLEVRVLDASVGKKAKFLGAVRLGSGLSDEPFDDPSVKECTAWQKLLQEPNKSAITTLGLRSTLGSLKSSAALPPILVEREEDIQYQVREKKSDSILSQTSISSATDDASSLRGTLTRGKLKPQPDQFSLQSFGSMLSIYSDAGGYGSVPISGEILFSIKYDNIAGVFEVHIQKAKGIAAVNKKTRASDPYVKTYLLPDKSKESKKKTNFKRRTVNPNWDEKIKYKIGEKDIMKRTLQVSIWNHEKFGHNDFLGEVQVQIQQYVKSGHSVTVHEPIWYTLQESAPVSVGEAVYKGSITVGLKFDQIDGEIGNLMVDIRQAKDLSAADPTQLSNPFVKSYLLPDRTRKSKRKSTFKKGTLDPVWNEKFEYSGVTMGDLEHRVLELTVWDHDLHTNDFLGGTRLGLERGDESWHDCMGKEVSIWNAMIEHPGIWVQYIIPLRDSMTSRKGLDVKIPEVEQIAKPEPANEPQVAQNKFDVTYPVVKDGKNVKSHINIDHSAPVCRIGLMFVTMSAEGKKTKGTLKMMIKEARNLPHLPNGETPSTYCRCQLKPSRMSWRTKTDIFKRSSEPVWDSLFEFEDVDDLETKCAEIVLCNDQNDKIGLVRLGSGLMQESWDDSKGREKEIWMATMEKPNEWNYLMIPLRMNINEKSNQKIRIDESQTNAKTFENVSAESAVTPASPPEEKPVSAKELALQSMGSHPVSVRGQESRSKPRSQSQDNLFRTLSLIREEDDVDGQSRVKFADGDKHETSTRRHGNSVPSIMISQEKGAIMGSNEIPDKDVDIDAEPELPSNLKKMSKFGSRESISSRTSVYSTMSHSAVGGIPVRGSIQFGLVYNSCTHTFQVHIFKAENIAAVDAKKEISDPYVKAYLLPDKTKATKKKTKVKFKTLNPEWNEILEYRMPLNELRTKTLMISIWNYDRLGRNIFLGEVLLPMVEKIDEGALKGHTSDWYELAEMRSESSKIVYKGQILIALRFEDHTLGISVKKEKKNAHDKRDKKDKKKKKEKGRIHIHVIKGEDLPAGDDSGLCDPYCKFYLLPLRQSKTKRKTSVIRGTREAHWDYQTEYDVDFDELPELGIEFAVYDWDKSSRNDFLGCARLNLGGRTGKWDDALGIEREAWQKLINEPNVRHEFVIPLRSSLGTRPLEEHSATW